MDTVATKRSTNFLLLIRVLGFFDHGQSHKVSQEFMQWYPVTIRFLRSHEGNLCLELVTYL